MRQKTFIIILVCFVLVLATLDIASAYDTLDGGAVAITGGGTLPLTPGRLLDDFSGLEGVNLWRDLAVTFSSDDTPPISPGASCISSLTSDTNITFGRSGSSLKLDYNVTDTDSYAGYYSLLGGQDLSAYKYLSFWVKGSTGGEFFKIEMKNNLADNNRNHAAVYITDYLDGGVTTAWQKVVIPFDAFANINNWTSMKELTIVFEQWQHNHYNAYNIKSEPSGTLYIDNINFGEVFLGYLRVDHFGDKTEPSALGGMLNNWSADGGSGQHSFSHLAGNYHAYQCGLLFRYNVNNADSRAQSLIYIIVGGGNDAWQGMSKDLSDYEHLSLWIKAQSASQNPKGIYMQVSNMTIEGFPAIWPINENTMPAGEISPTVWKNYVLDIEASTEGSPVNRTDVREIKIVCQKSRRVWAQDGITGEPGWHYFGIGDLGGDLVGGIYVDEVEFRDTAYHNGGPDITAPAAPTGLNFVDGGNTVTVNATAASFNNNIYINIECVRFEYNDGGTWRIISSDYDTANSAYGVAWNVQGIASGSYQLRAIAMDPSGNDSPVSNIVIYTKP